VQYFSAEIFGLLNITKQILPVDGEDWNEVSHLHDINFPNNGPKLKRKFQQLNHSHVQIGDPMCQPDVRRGKHLKEMIRDKAEIDSAEGEVIFDPCVLGNQKDGAAAVLHPVVASEEVSVVEEE